MKRTTTNSRNVRNRASMVEALEARTLFAGVSEVDVYGGVQLVIDGTAAADHISITQDEAGLTVSTKDGWRRTFGNGYRSVRVNAGAGNDVVVADASVVTDVVLYGDAGNDTLTGGAGNDRLFGGAGNDVINAGAGDDVIVTIGGGKDRVAGDAGDDAFWVDKAEQVQGASAAELATGVHRVTAFASVGTASGRKVKLTKVSTELNGQAIADPALSGNATGYQNFSTRPLFADAGPTADDVAQGSVGDCYFLAQLSGVAGANPNAIRDRVVDLGDGTYAVQFAKGRSSAFVRVDADLPVWNGTLAYADFGRDGSTWVAVMEKAFAYVRTGVASYAAIEAGWMSEAASFLGLPATSAYDSSTVDALTAQLAANLSAGKVVTYATRELADESVLVGGHAYLVTGVTTTAAGVVTHVALRNPWAIDGLQCHDVANDGHLTVTAAEAFAAFSGATFANVA